MWALALASALLLGQASLEGPADRCRCREPRAASGWCRVHQLGYVGDVPIRSAWLYDTVDPHGHDVDVTRFPCPGCQRAIATDGFCAEHKVGFVAHRAYFSVLTHHLAKGEVLPPAGGCARCRKNARGHGWCEAHEIGRIGAVALRDRQAYDEAVHSAEILRVASQDAARCDRCAAARIMDTVCPHCRIAYRDGKPIGGARAKPGAQSPATAKTPPVQPPGGQP
jgi:hypothetical protein